MDGGYMARAVIEGAVGGVFIGVFLVWMASYV